MGVQWYGSQRFDFLPLLMSGLLSVMTKNVIKVKNMCIQLVKKKGEAPMAGQNRNFPHPLTLVDPINPIQTMGTVTCMVPYGGPEVLCTMSSGHVAVIDTSSGKVTVVAGKTVQVRDPDLGLDMYTVDGDDVKMTPEDFRKSIRGRTAMHGPANPLDVVYWEPHSIFWCGAADGWVIADRHSQLSLLSKDFDVVTPFVNMANAVQCRCHPLVDNGMTCLSLIRGVYLFEIVRFKFNLKYVLDVSKCCSNGARFNTFRENFEEALATVYKISWHDVSVERNAESNEFHVEITCDSKVRQMEMLYKTVAKSGDRLRPEFVNEVRSIIELPAGVDVNEIRWLELNGAKQGGKSLEQRCSRVRMLGDDIDDRRYTIDGESDIYDMCVLPNGRVIMHAAEQIFELAYTNVDGTVITGSESGTWRARVIMNPAVEARRRRITDFGPTATFQCTNPGYICPIFCGKQWGFLMRDDGRLLYADKDKGTVSAYNLRQAMEQYVTENFPSYPGSLRTLFIYPVMVVLQDGTLLVCIKHNSYEKPLLIKITGFPEQSVLPSNFAVGEEQVEYGGAAAASSSSVGPVGPVGPVGRSSSSSLDSSSSSSDDDDDSSSPPRKISRGMMAKKMMRLRF